MKNLLGLICFYVSMLFMSLSGMLMNEETAKMCYKEMVKNLK
jgi:hypothetical protein